MLANRSTSLVPRTVAVFATVAAASILQTTAGAQTIQGPLPPRDNDPINTLFLRPSPVDAFVLGRSEGRLAASLDVSNNLITIAEPGNRQYQVDFEEQRLSLAYGRGLGGGQELDVQLPLISRDGGVLDGVIDTFHRMFGFQGGGRAGIPEGRTIYQVTNADGQTIVDRNRSAGGVGDLVLEYRRSLTSGPDSQAVYTGAPASAASSARQLAASLRAFVKLPTGDSGQLLGSGAADVGVGGAVSARPGRQLALHGNVALVYAGRPRLENFTSRRDTLVHSLVAVEYLWSRRTSLVVQTDDCPAPVRTGIAYADRPRRAFTFGFWHRTGPADRLFVSMSQNDFGPAAKVAPDVTISTGLLWRLR